MLAAGSDKKMFIEQKKINKLRTQYIFTNYLNNLNENVKNKNTY